ncbi:hypothetical protein pb186bvf_011237 [Paramecium bursaria]
MKMLVFALLALSIAQNVFETKTIPLDSALPNEGYNLVHLETQEQETKFNDESFTSPRKQRLEAEQKKSDSHLLNAIKNSKYRTSFLQVEEVDDTMTEQQLRDALLTADDINVEDIQMEVEDNITSNYVPEPEFVPQVTDGDSTLETNDFENADPMVDDIQMPQYEITGQ